MSSSEDVGLCGLENVGYMCYMNVILQCLYNIKDFSKYFRHKRYNQIECDDVYVFHEEPSVDQSKALTELFKKMHSTAAPTTVDPLIFKDIFSKNPLNGWRYRSKEDWSCAIFMEHLLAVLHKELESEFISNHYKETHPDESFVHYIEIKVDSFISIQFWGVMKKTCRRCDLTEYEFFEKMTLSNFHQDRDLLSLISSNFLNLFPWKKCWSCSRQPPDTEIKISRFPKILTITLLWGEQPYVNIDIPMVLDLNQFKSSITSQQDPIYRLKSVVNYCTVAVGSEICDHFYAFCKKKHKWYNLNDTSVEEIENLNIPETHSPELLLYKNKRNP